MLKRVLGIPLIGGNLDVVDAFQAALDAVESPRADAAAMQHAGDGLDAVGATDCGATFVSG